MFEDELIDCGDDFKNHDGLAKQLQLEKIVLVSKSIGELKMDIRYMRYSLSDIIEENVYTVDTQKALRNLAKDINKSEKEFVELTGLLETLKDNFIEEF